MKTDRTDVYRAIDSERKYQDFLAQERGWSEDDRVPAKSVGDFLVLLKVYVDRALVAWTDNAGVESALDGVRKVAGIAVQCMEENGAPHRTGVYL